MAFMIFIKSQVKDQKKIIKERILETVSKTGT
jgi:hypothetical protein